MSSPAYHNLCGLLVESDEVPRYLYIWFVNFNFFIVEALFAAHSS
jgi:hypothetical protein